MSGERRSASRASFPISWYLLFSASSVGIHVAVEIGFHRVWAVHGVVEGGERLVQDLALHLFSGLGIDQSGALQELVVGLDRAESLPRFALGDVAVARLAVVASAAVRAEAIELGFDEGRSAARARARDGFPRRLVHRQHVGAVNENGRHAV